MNTINNQTRAIYEKTGSQNLADVTRHVIDRLLPNTNLETLLNDAIRCSIYIVVGCAVTIAAY